jgi:hypothetical protein
MVVSTRRTPQKGLATELAPETRQSNDDEAEKEKQIGHVKTADDNTNEESPTKPFESQLYRRPQHLTAKAKLFTPPRTIDRTRAHSKEVGNGLSQLIPGYVAPQALDTSSLSPFQRNITQLRQDAEQSMHPPGTFLPTNYAAASFKTGKKSTPDPSLGWFNSMATEVTDEVKADIALIRNRTYLDPKRFYKRTDKSFGTNFIQIGTVVEGNTEYYSSRLTNKERKATLLEEVLADSEASSYVKRKYLSMQHERQAAAEHRNKKKRKVSKQAKRGY